MCDVITALKIATTVYEFQANRAVAKAQNRANDQTRKNSDQAYLYDLSKIDNEAVATSREKIAEKFKLKQEELKKQAQALNLGAGMGDKIIQDIAGAYDLQFLDVTRDYEYDMVKLNAKEDEAYAAQQRRYNSIKPVQMPSTTGLLLSVATTGAQGYQSYLATQPKSEIGRAPTRWDEL